jgi:hypothetical protein
MTEKPRKYTSQVQQASRMVVLAELGTLSLEFTRLTQLTKDPQYYDAVARITDALEEMQTNTTLPGMWPVYIDASGCAETQDSTCTPRGLASSPGSRNDTFTLGGKSDSTYEYLVKVRFPSIKCVYITNLISRNTYSSAAYNQNTKPCTKKPWKPSRNTSSSPP